MCIRDRVRRLPVVEVLGVGVVLGRAAEERAEHGFAFGLAAAAAVAWRSQKPKMCCQLAVCAYASPYRARRYVAWATCSHRRYDVHVYLTPLFW